MHTVEVNHVSVRYIRGNYKNIGLKEYLMRKIRGEYQVTKFWANQDISFALDQGDMLGIIGSNGAGKSTVLKVIAGILQPTEGSVWCNGKVAALLELSSGFDNEMTVRENTYLRGAIMGYSREFMDQKYDEIIQYAELQDFQDCQFSQLSSGMRSRLAFSIASLVAPDILILDEVLSVGDGRFRKKSEKKMRQVIQNGATTILVSHSIEQIKEMCNKVLWMEKGQQIAFGATETICDLYSRFQADEITLEEAKSLLTEAGIH